jgi:hypothetical protein
MRQVSREKGHLLAVFCLASVSIWPLIRIAAVELARHRSCDMARTERLIHAWPKGTRKAV